MPRGLTALELSKYYYLPKTIFGKSVQPNWKFTVAFLQPFLKNFVVKADLGLPPIIQPHHVLGVTVPTYNFDNQVMMYGQVPRTFPVLDTESAQFKVNMTLEEDEMGTISYLINWLQRSIITPEGYYRPLIEATFGTIVVTVEDMEGIPVVLYNFHDCYYLTSDSINLSYDSNDSIKYNVVFGVGHMETIYTKYNPVSIATGAIRGAVKNIDSIKNNKKLNQFI